MSSLLQQALDVAQEFDVAVFPVSADKRPILKGWRHKASRDPARIREMFSMPGARGIAVPCGPDNDLVCFDLDFGHTEDPDRKAALQAWLDRWSDEIERGAVVRKTRSGGLHVIMLWPKGLTPPRRIMPKLDVIIDGFYFVWAMDDGSYGPVIGDVISEEPSQEMIEILERDTLGSGSSMMTPDEAHEAMWSNGDAGMRHDALLRMTHDWSESFPGMTREEWCESFEEWFRETYGDRIELDRLDVLMAWEGERGELWRAFERPSKTAPLSDELLARAGEKLKAMGAVLPTQEPPPPAARRPSGLIFKTFAGRKPPPPRQWVFGERLLKGQVTTLVAPGGTGKSMLMQVWALSMASGTALLSDAPHHRMRVLLWSGEDDAFENDRRQFAVLNHYGDIDVEGHLAVETASDRDLRLVTKVKNNIKVHDDKVDGLIEDLKANEIEVLILDPLIAMHGVNENDNAEMDVVMDQLVRIAREANVAVCVVHHVGKGSMRDDRKGDPADAARGATAIINRARVGLALRIMTPAEANQKQLTEGDRYRFVQIIDAKANLGVRKGYGSTSWFELVSRDVGNATEDYPEGDRVGVPIPFAMGDVMVTDVEAFVRVVEAMESETARPEWERRNRQSAQSSQWLGHLVAAACNLHWGEYSRQEMRNVAQQAAYERTQEIINEMVVQQIIEKGDVIDEKRNKRPGYVLSRSALTRINELKLRLGEGL